VERTVAVADLVKASDEDLEAFYPHRPHAESAAALLELGPAVVVVTRGADGAVWLDREGAVEITSRPVQVADTIGAGDTFGAGLLDALWERGRLGAEGRPALARLPRAEVVEVLEHAARAAAVTVSRPGADPPYRHEL
jgi:fructokinase